MDLNLALLLLSTFLVDLNLALVTPERFPGGLESCFSYFMSAFLVDLNLALLLLSAFLVDLNLAVVTP